MKTVVFILFISLSIVDSSIAQTGNLTVYDTIAANVCNCYNHSTEDEMPSEAVTTCVMNEFRNNGNAFVKMGLDTSLESVRKKILLEIMTRVYRDCRSFVTDFQLEKKSVVQNPGEFSGTFVRQIELQPRKYEIILKDGAGRKKFYSTQPFDETKLKGYLSYTLTIRYTAIQNRKLGLIEKFIDPSSLSIIGSRKILK